VGCVKLSWRAERPADTCRCLLERSHVKLTDFGLAHSVTLHDGSIPIEETEAETKKKKACLGARAR
jgi:hypothetical protein